MSDITEAHFGYSAEYKWRRERKWYQILLGGSEFIQIDDIASVDAPAGYRISSGWRRTSKDSSQGLFRSA